MSLYDMMMEDAKESENATAKNAIKDYIKSYVAPLNQQVLDIDEQVENLTETVKALSATQLELIKTIQKLEQDRDILYTIVDMQATELKAMSGMYEAFMELMKWKER